MLNRKIPPPIHDAIAFDYNLPPINVDSLNNGLPLYWLNGGVQDVAEIVIVFPAGIWYEQKQALAQAMGALLKNGTSKKTAHEIHEALEFFGASMKVNVGNDFASLSLYALTKHLPQLLPVVYEIITDAQFPETELNIYKQNAIQRLLVNLRQCEFVANQKIDALVYGETHPYGRFSQKEKIESVQREDVIAFYKTHFTLSGARIFIAGKISEREVKLVNEVFGKDITEQKINTTENFSMPPASERNHSITNDPNGVQGAIRIGRQFINRHHPDFGAMVVLNTLFGGYFGSRLMSNIREEKGFTYGIYSSMEPLLHGGSFTVHTEVGKDVIEPAIKEIYHEMNVLCEELIPEEELLLVKNYLLGNLLGDLDGPFQIMQRWRSLILNGLTEAHFYKNIHTYKTISAKELQALAQKYFSKEDYYEVVVI